MYALSTRRLAGAILGLVFTLASFITHAQPVTFDFEGVVRSDTFDYGNELPAYGISVGSTITGSFTFESTVADTAANTDLGLYPMLSPLGFNLSVGSLNVAASGYDLKVSTLAPGTYEISKANFTSGSTPIEWFRILVQGIALPDDSLPLNAPDITGASTALIQLWDGDFPDAGSLQDRWRIQADLTSLTGGIDQGSAPAPATLLLMLGVLGGLYRFRNKRGQ